jgi:hypothetical protein
MKIPKFFFKLDSAQQESFLIKKLQENHIEEDRIKTMLAQVRGGYHFEPSEIDRPDLLEMKVN